MLTRCYLYNKFNINDYFRIYYERLSLIVLLHHFKMKIIMIVLFENRKKY